MEQILRGLENDHVSPCDLQGAKSFIRKMLEGDCDDEKLFVDFGALKLTAPLLFMITVSLTRVKTFLTLPEMILA
jgi:hypothetical protein